jgi:thiazole/oxazole-forming peptide maturase SagD family component
MPVMRHYPPMAHLMNRYQALSGNQTGIMPGFAISVAEIEGEPAMRTMTATMPNYHRIAMDNPTMEMQYHLSGYGLRHEEAFVKLSGEAVERYAAVMATGPFRNRLRYATYRELSASERCMPLKYLGIFDDQQQRRIHELMPRYSPTRPTEDDVIAWIQCPSLVRPGENCWVPAQMFFLAYTADPEHNDQIHTPSFSTGTAAHVSLEAALAGAMVEAIHIDAFIVNWYTGNRVPRVLIDDDYVLRYLGGFGLTDDGPYRLIVSYLTRPELPLPTFGVFLERKTDTFPLVTFGVQGGTDPRLALVRGTAESTAIIGLGTYSAIFDTANLHYAVNESSFTDLDTNVLWWASPVDAAAKRALIESRLEGAIPLSTVPSLDSADSGLPALVKMIADFSEWAVYLDITPPELAGTDWKVVRVLIPELCSMCLPGLPPREHPRLTALGGVTRDEPHPLP